MTEAEQGQWERSISKALLQLCLAYGTEGTVAVIFKEEPIRNREPWKVLYVTPPAFKVLWLIDQSVFPVFSVPKGDFKGMSAKV